MKKLIPIILGVLVIGSVAYLQVRDTQNLEYTNISPEEAKEMIDSDNIVILDVRTKSEYDKSHLPNTTLYPLQKLENNTLNLSKKQKIIVVCKIGYRSSKASKELVKRGYKNVYNLEGGLTAWVENGYKVIKPSEEEKSEIKVGNIAPNFKLEMGENTFSLNDHQENIILLDFLSAQCEACRREVEELKKISENYPKLIILSIGIDDYALKQLKNEKNADWPFVENRDVLENYGVEVFPTIFIIGRSGVVRFKHRGFLSYGEISNELENLEL